MALVECPDCKAHVSEQAAACPKCGYPIGPSIHDGGYKRARGRMGCLWFAMGIVALVLVLALFRG
jgi:predicted amidophosphoribosyltransferase